MKIATVNARNALWWNQEKTTHRWAEVFFQKYCEKDLTREEAKSYTGDVLIGLNGRPDLEQNVPPKEFKKLKFMHGMDFWFYPDRAYSQLCRDGVQYLLGYNDYSKHSMYFRMRYKGYVGWVLPVPFGYDRRFQVTRPFEERKNLCIGLGAVNPLDEGIDDLKDQVLFYKGKTWAQPWRAALRAAYLQGNLGGVMDSLFPEPEKDGHKKFDYDIVETYNDYKMFTTCESIYKFPSVKVYEGMACGSVFVGNQHPCYEDIGLIDGVNCILHEPDDFADFRRKIMYYQEHQDRLETISQNGVEFVQKNYSPENIAERLYSAIYALWQK